jgi:NAD(P)H-hydrate epimerase
VLPVVTVAEMRAADAEALRSVTEEVLVARAGTAVARRALAMLGGAYGRRVVVIAGPGNNGADGRVAAAALARRGARTVVVAPSEPGDLPPADLVIDAAYGTGFRGTYDAPPVPPGVPVLAVDIPSGVSGDTGIAAGRPLRAVRTVTFAALKPGLLQGDGAELAGEIAVAGIGIGTGRPGAGVVEDADVPVFVPRRSRRAHKWEAAVAVVAGSPGMEGAAALCAAGASHAGAGMVRLAVPGSRDPSPPGGARRGPWPLEAVRVPLDRAGWADEVLPLLARCGALVVGPGLGRDEATAAEVRRLVARSPVPVVVDADALIALGGADAARRVVAESGRPVVLTPHDGEYRALSPEGPPGPDRLAAARRLAEQTGAVVLLKGSPTVVAAAPGSASATTPGAAEGWSPDVLVSTAGSPRLATAGTGDVLSGVIGAFIARGMAPLHAAGLAAHVHGRAAASGPAEGLVAGDLPVLISRCLSSLVGRG